MKDDSLLENGCSVVIALVVLAVIVFGVSSAMKGKQYADIIERATFRICVRQELSSDCGDYAKSVRELFAWDIGICEENENKTIHECLVSYGLAREYGE